MNYNNIILQIYLVVSVSTAFGFNYYNSKRDEVLRKESELAVGGKTKLTEKENKVNDCLMRHKLNELEYGFNNPRYFNLSHHYFTYKQKIKDSKVYRIIRDMPKGAVLHVHDMGMLGADYLMNLTYMDHLYVCFKDKLRFRFSNTVPEIPCEGKWKLISEVRKGSGNIENFDKELRGNFSIVVDEPDREYPSINDVWARFMNFFIVSVQILSYRPVWEQYFYDALKRFREDNILYVEVRSVLPNLYELDGNVYNQLITAKAYRKTLKHFMTDYPDFIGAKLIFAPSRQVDSSTVVGYLNLAKEIKNEMPDFFAGFDLVGQEDLGRPLIDFVPQLTAASKDFNYFFHAGETDWFGVSTDENLIDAILLGAKRIGHGYALSKHPVLMQEVLKNDIGVEVNVISNEVLFLVHDIRNHPLSTFIAQGLPIVLSGDDPGAWEADPISHDFYIAFVGVASKHSDLRLIKTLALNSLKYSSLSGQLKTDAIDKFQLKWNEFVDKFNCSAY